MAYLTIWQYMALDMTGATIFCLSLYLWTQTMDDPYWSILGQMTGIWIWIWSRQHKAGIWRFYHERN